MMEEVSDDTNGESSFEFVSGKIDENPTKDECAPVASDLCAALSSTASLGSASSTYPSPSPVPSSSAPTFPLTAQNTESNIAFYDPKDSKSVMLPPLISPTLSTPSTSSQASSSVLPGMQSQFSPIQQSFSPVNVPSQAVPPQTFQVPPTQQPYSLPSTQQSYSLPPTQQPYSTPPVRQPYSIPPTQEPYSLPPMQLHSVRTTQHSTLELPVAMEGERRLVGGLWGWLRSQELLNKMAEKAKNSVDSVITTLDPGMKEIINTGGDINVIVASSNEDKVSAVREAFQLVFGKATVQGYPARPSSIAPQPVGFSAGLKAAEECINNLKQMGFAQDRQILLAIENFLTELTPDNWFDIGCLLLQDQSSGITLQVYTQAIPISSDYISLAKEQTPADYPLGWSGYAVTIGQLLGPALDVDYTEWHEALTGVSRREILLVPAKTIARLYRSRLMS